MPRHLTAGRARQGFSLAELLVVVVVLGIVGGSIVKLIASNQRFYRGTSDIVDARTQVRHALTVLSTDLRSTSSAGGDIVSIGDTAVTLVANTGSSVLCQRNPADARELYLPPRNLANHQLTGWLSVPEIGDQVFVYDEGLSRGAEDDRWVGYTIAGIAQSTTYCVGAPYTDPVKDNPAAKPRIRVTLTVPMSATIRVGAGVRFGRQVRYSLYQSPSDRKWYLGYREMRAGVWQGIQPVSGPYTAYAANGAGGIGFQYFDSTGTVLPLTAVTSRVSRVDIRVRGQGQDATTLSDGKRGIYVDSLLMRVSIRNRS